MVRDERVSQVRHMSRLHEVDPEHAFVLAGDLNLRPGEDRALLLQLTDLSLSLLATLHRLQFCRRCALLLHFADLGLRLLAVLRLDHLLE